MLIWFKVAGLTLLSLSICAFGFIKALSLQNRQLQLRQMILSLDGFISRLQGAPCELSVLLPECFGDCSFLEITGAKAVCKKGDLDRKDRSIIDEFFASLGFGVARGEISRARAYKSVLERRFDEITKQSLPSVRLWQTFGISIGAAVAILLI